MKTPKTIWLVPLALLPWLAVPAQAAIKIRFLKPSQAAPQTIGTSIAWSARANDSAAGPLTFQFSVGPPHGPVAMVKDFNVGKPASGDWVSLPFVWTPTGIEGTYRIQVVAKDFATGESSSRTLNYKVDPLVTGATPVVVGTQNPLVALFSAPACPAHSSMRVHFQQTAYKFPGTDTFWMQCHPAATMTFEIAGMYPSTAYRMFSETKTGKHVMDGPVVTYTTGALPARASFPTFKVTSAAGADPNDVMILHGATRLGVGEHYPDVATDLAGNIMWFYYPSDVASSNIITRPLADGTFLAIESGPAWNPLSEESQMLRQVDLAGHIVHETNTGVIQQELLALGAVDTDPCNTIPSPAPIGSACLGAFHHDMIRSLPNGYSAVFAEIEKIFPPGTQGDTSGLPVDIMGDMIIVLDANWQVKWYFDTFEHAGGPPELDLQRPAVLGETCVSGQMGCPPIFLLSAGIAPYAHDWLHANALYYWPQTKDIIWSSRHQDWVVKVDYNDTKGTGKILWRMGPEGDFNMNNVFADPWPWFSHQHEVGIENNGVMTLLDNGNTRVSPPSGPNSSTGGLPGLGATDCGPFDCNSRGMALNFDETSMQVTPLAAVDLGQYSEAMGSAQLLDDGNYFFVAAIVVAAGGVDSYDLEVTPTPASGAGNQVLNMSGSEVYRDWLLPSLYEPPIT